MSWRFTQARYRAFPRQKNSGRLWLMPMTLARVRTGEHFPNMQTRIKCTNHKVHIMKYWLAKQEPSGPRGYSFEQFKKDGKTVWDGVHNNLALKHMRSMSKGRSCVILIIRELCLPSTINLAPHLPLDSEWFRYDFMIPYPRTRSPFGGLLYSIR